MVKFCTFSSECFKQICCLSSAYGNRGSLKDLSNYKSSYFTPNDVTKNYNFVEYFWTATITIMHVQQIIS
jgi:hypothetical protein